MFLFALKMYVADTKRFFKSFWWLAPISIILMVIAPFNVDLLVPTLAYMVGWIIMVNIPRYSRIHFIVPLDEKQLKQFFLWRIVIVCGMMSVVVAIFLGLCEWRKWSWSPQGLYCLAAWIVLTLLCGEIGLQGLGIKKKFEVRHVGSIIIGILSMFFAWGVITEDVSLKWGVCLSYSLVILAIIYMFGYLRNVKIEDYTYVPFTSWENGKKERD